MSRFRSFSLAFFVSLLACICLAQQPANKGRRPIVYDEALSDSALLPTAELGTAIGSMRLPALHTPSSPDNWNGGIGNWSNGARPRMFVEIFPNV